ncbi:hypothetical protein MNBD_CHLOROFLEXI01-2062 [hydrothermal vent metagenome]|uniref:Uncharacterized protein n=1 Tax=hydrothermal vent metagenome TaxID=652676 RepID=A0A3B0UYR6_9ZZZZ
MSLLSPPNRPHSVTLTFWSVIFFGTFNLGRAIAIGQQLNLQQTLNIQPDPRFRLAAAGLFGVLFLGLAGKLWWKRPFTIKAIPIAIACYAVYETAVWGLFTQPPRNGSLWLLISLIFISNILFTRWALRRNAKTYFHYE